MADDPLYQYYNYWDARVDNWIGDDNAGPEYLPEPWWGWTPYEGHPLYCVVINLNPGDGTLLQKRDCMRCFVRNIGNNIYSRFMPEFTRRIDYGEKWHYNNRYKPIMRAIGITNLPNQPDISNYLALELSAQHGQINYTKEFTKNAVEIYNYILCFAAEAAKNIEKHPAAAINLNKIVLVRAASAHINNIKK